MRKNYLIFPRTLLLTAALAVAATTGAQAQDTDATTATITVDMNNGSFGEGNAAGTYFKEWISTSSDPQLTLTVSVNNMASSGSNPLLYRGGSTCTYTLATASEGWTISSYSFDFTNGNTSYDVTITPAGEKAVTCEGSGTASVSVTDINATSTSFDFSAGSNVYATVTNFIVTLEKEGDVSVSGTAVASTADLVDGYYIIKGARVDGTQTGSYVHYNPNITTGDYKNRYYRLGDAVTSESETIDTDNYDYVWKLENNTEDGTFTLQNVLYGTYFIADANSGENFLGTETANLKIVVEEEDNADGVTAGWYMTMTNYKHSDTDTYLCTNQPNDGYGDNLSWWQYIGNGVDLLLEFYPVTDTQSGALDAALEEVSLTNKIATYLTPYFDNPGCIVLVDGEAAALPTAAATSLQDAYDALMASPTETAYETLLASVKSALVAPEDGIWTITSMATTSRNGEAITSVGTVVAADGTVSTSLTSATPNGITAPMLWKFTTVEGGYKVVNVNTELMLEGSTGTGQISLTSGTDNNTYTFTERDGADLAIGCGNDLYLNAWNGAGYSDLGLWTGSTDGNSGWKVELVDAIDGTISSAGYATVCFPVAVTLPEGVTAYTVESATTDVIYLADYEGPTLPAKTGILIAGEGEYSFAFADDSDPAETGFVGVCPATTIDGNVTAYVLAQPDGDEVGFYIVNDDDRTLNANKAYYVPSSTSGSNALRFSFGDAGMATGISTATTPTTDGAKVYYDLNGRRVLYPSRGIYVTADGQKVFIK